VDGGVLCTMVTTLWHFLFHNDTVLFSSEVKAAADLESSLLRFLRHTSTQQLFLLLAFFTENDYVDGAFWIKDLVLCIKSLS